VRYVWPTVAAGGARPSAGQGKLTLKDPKLGGFARINRHVLEPSAAASGFALDERLASGRAGTAEPRSPEAAQPSKRTSGPAGAPASSAGRGAQARTPPRTAGN
jgi:hypothetical protein